jgi:hypothetical protein
MWRYYPTRSFEEMVVGAAMAPSHPRSACPSCGSANAQGPSALATYHARLTAATSMTEMPVVVQAEGHNRGSV